MREILSRREWVLTFKLGSTEKVNLLSIYEKSENENDFEFKYALQDSIDEILDMKINETIYFQYNRDDQNSKGLLTRIN